MWPIRRMDTLLKETKLAMYNISVCFGPGHYMEVRVDFVMTPA